VQRIAYRISKHLTEALLPPDKKLVDLAAREGMLLRGPSVGERACERRSGRGLEGRVVQLDDSDDDSTEGWREKKRERERELLSHRGRREVGDIYSRQ
jgi:hypothetical protein